MLKVGEGAEGNVFKISDGLVAKVLNARAYNSNCIREILEKEFETANDLYANGVRIPRPRGIFDLNLFKDGIKYPCFVMQYIHGVDIEKLVGLEREFAIKKQKKELEKAINLGYEPCDTDASNAILSRGRVYLIDFIGWRKTNFNPLSS